MPGALWSVPYWSVVEKLKSRKLVLGQRNVNRKFGFSENITTSIGNNDLKYCPKSTTVSIQKQIVDALCMGERDRASKLLLELGQRKMPLKHTAFVPILKYCARSPDPLFVIETWKIMDDKKVGLDNNCYLLMIQALCKGGYLEEAANLINFNGESNGIYPGLPVYNTYLEACAKMKSVLHANQCLDLMERRLVGKNEITYSTLLKLAVWQQNLSAVHEMWKDYFKCYSPSFFALHNFIWSFVRLRDLKSAYETLQCMVALAFRGNTSVDTASRVQLHSSKLDIPILLNGGLGLQNFQLKDNEQAVLATANTSAINVQECITLDVGKKKVDSTGLDRAKLVLKVLRLSFGDVMDACAQAKNSGLAKQLVFQMQNIGLQPSSHSYNALVRAVVSNGCFREGMEMLETMQKRKMKIYDGTLAIISVACSKELELNLAEGLLYQITNYPYPYPFNVFLEACDKMDQPERAVRMLAKMKQLNVKLDIRTYELLFSLFGKVNAPYEDGDMLSQVDSAERIKAIVVDMVKNDVQHSWKSMANLDTLCMMERISILIRLCESQDSTLLMCANSICSSSRGIHTDDIHDRNLTAAIAGPQFPLHSMTARFGHFQLTSLGKEGTIRELIRYFHVAEDLFCRCNTYPGITIYNKLLHSLVKAQECHKAIELFKHVRSSGFKPNAVMYGIMIDCCRSIRCYKSACALVSLVLRSGFNLRPVIYTALIKILLQDDNFDETFSLLDQVRSEEIKLDVLLYNPILKWAKEKGRIDIIELIVEWMRREKIQPDTTTCDNVFSAYVFCGFHGTAMEALQALSMWMISEDDCVLQEKQAELKDLILSEDSEEVDSRIFEHFKDFENVGVALWYLRWLAIIGFPICWSPNQTIWARRLCANYDRRRRERWHLQTQLRFR